MTVEASGIISKPLDNLRTLLASGEAMQEWVGVDAEDVGTPTGVAEAKEHIYLWTVGESEDDNYATRAARRPLVRLDYTEGIAGEKMAEGSTYWQHDGPIQAIFEKVVPAACQGSTADACLDLANDAGAIIEGMMELAGSDDYLNATGWQMPTAPARMDPKLVSEDGELDLVQTEILINWGDG